MNENYVELDVPFSTADTIGKAELSYKDRRLKLIFQQFDDAMINIEFSDVIGFRWDDNYLSKAEVAPDRVYQIETSRWKSKLNKELGINLDKYHHYKLYFISEGAALDVIASSMEKT